MKVLIQRVRKASVDIGGRKAGSIGKGLLLLLCAEKGDTGQDLAYTLRKVLNLRIFEDDGGKMNLSVRDTGGEILVVPQFTLAGRLKKGNRPSFDSAEAPDRAKAIFERFIEDLLKEGLTVKTGKFGEYMQVGLINDGPVTIMIESRG